MDEKAGTLPTVVRRGRKPLPAVAVEELIGRHYLSVIQNYLHDLHKLYPHHNRVLFYDDVAVTYLLAFFNPTLRSLRCIEDASQAPGINRFLNVEAVCRSTLSDANALFDAKHMHTEHRAGADGMTMPASPGIKRSKREGAKK